jgi:hypothetical protein
LTDNRFVGIPIFWGEWQTSQRPLFCAMPGQIIHSIKYSPTTTSSEINPNVDPQF